MAEMRPDARIVCIGGMHCSGTSAVARIVNLLGIDFGPPAVGAPARRSNTKGLWEHPDLTRLGEGILRTLGGSWDDPPRLAPGWHSAPELDEHRKSAREILETAFGASEAWGWKDPRNCLLAPFWEDLLGPLRYVICIRNPLDVASSLERRDGMAREQAYDLWLRYTRGALETSHDRPRVTVCYEDLWSGLETLRPLAEFLGRPDAVETSEFRAAVTGWLDEGLWHHRTGAGYSDDPEAVPADLDRLYQELRDSPVGGAGSAR